MFNFFGDKKEPKKEEEKFPVNSDVQPQDVSSEENNDLFPGVVEDPRSEDEKAQDYQTEEVMKLAGVSAQAEPVIWIEKRPEQWRGFLLRDQNGSGSCVAQTGGKLLEIENKLEEPNIDLIQFSAYDIYDRRKNKPAAGMWGADALNICSKFGATTEVLLPSQRMTESQMNQPVQRTPEMISVAQKYRAGGYLQLPLNIESIASFIQKTGKGVMIFVSFEYDEWTDVPTLKYPGDRSLRHSITAVEPILWQGKKALVIEDSWGKFNEWKGRRVLTEEFLNARLFFAGHLLDLSNTPVPPSPVKPKFHFTKHLVFGMRNDKEVVGLQKMLRFEGLFPSNVDFTGNFLQITAKAVKAWQINHGIMDFANEKDMRKIRFGQKSVALANNLYA